jgi:8-oxo-dGTP pyrophosphatase MutT (NUDIX family)
VTPGRAEDEAVAERHQESGAGGGFRLASERAVYEGSVISLVVGTFVAPDGETFERDVVHHPGAVSVVPLLDDGTVVLVRQFRSALNADLLEIPAGKRDVHGEAQETTARRELGEEIGMRADSVELLAEFHNSPGFCDEHSWVFLAQGLHPTAVDRQGIEEHHMVREHARLDDVTEMIADGRITDAKTIIGLLLTLRRLAC